jgi:cobalt/nickel transport system permease protein
MHIPASMLDGAICPVTLVAGATGLGLAAYTAFKSQTRPDALKFAAITSLIFALQMLNFPIQNGTSGHFFGAILALVILDIPFAVLSVSMVLSVQALIFGDGGLNTLGANIINMVFIGVFVPGLFLRALTQKIGRNQALIVSCWLSVVLAATVCSFEVALADTVTLSKVLPAMLAVHALIGIGEAAITICVLSLLNIWQKNDRVFAFGSFSLAIAAAFFSPFASSFPDGLEYVAQKLAFVKHSDQAFAATFSNYQVSFVSGSASMVMAAIIGIALVAFGTFVVSRLSRSN